MTPEMETVLSRAEEAVREDQYREAIEAIGGIDDSSAGEKKRSFTSRNPALSQRNTINDGCNGRTCVGSSTYEFPNTIKEAGFGVSATNTPPAFNRLADSSSNSSNEESSRCSITCKETTAPSDRSGRARN